MIEVFMEFWLLRLAAACILLATGGLVVFLVRQQKPVFSWSWRLLALGFLLLTLFMLLAYRQNGMLPVLTFKAALLFFAWAILGAYLLLYLKFKLMVLGSFLAPLAGILLIVSLLIPAPPLIVPPALKSPWLSLHILSSLLGNGMLAATFISALMYLVQERQIKQKRFGSFYKRLPSLETLDEIGRYSVICGFPLLTIGIITGSIYAQTAFGIYWRWDSKEVWTLVVWLLYAILLHERLAIGLRGRKAAWLSILAFLLLMFSFIGVNFWLSDYHRFEALIRPHLP
jgi:cytochrome c-type biogenesis protein CcsB